VPAHPPSDLSQKEHEQDDLSSSKEFPVQGMALGFKACSTARKLEGLILR